MRKIHRIDLDFAKDIRAQRKATFKEQDAITLYVNIFDDSIPVNVEAQTPRLFIRKPDGTILYQTEVLSVNNNTIAFDVNIQATTSPGICYAEIELIEPQEDGNDELITTKSFIYIVEPKVGDIKNAIASVDDAYFLKVVEDFIKQAKIDIAEYKEQASIIEERIEEAHNKLDQLNADLKEADFTLNESKEQALSQIADTTQAGLEELEAKKVDSIEKIDSKTKENLIKLDEKTIEGSAIIGDKTQNCIEELDVEIKEANQTISTLITKGREAMAINTGLSQTVTRATNIKADLDASIEEGKETITKIEDTVIKAVEEVEKLEGEVIVKVDSVSEEHLNTLKNAKDAHITEMESKKDEFIANINSKESELEETISDASNAIQTIENVIASANTIKNTLDTSKAEATTINNALNKLIETCKATKAELEAENTRAEVNIETLQGLHPQSNIRIETLSRLIEEAKKYEEVVRAYIAKFEPAMDLTEVNQKLEELYKAVEIIQIKLDDYYTKEEVDALLNSGFNGSIGVSAKYGSIPTSMYENAPEPPEVKGSEYIGKFLHTDGDKYYITYLYNNTASNYYPYMYADILGTENVIRDSKFSGSYGTFRGFYTTNGTSFIESSSFSMIYEERAKVAIYYSDFPIYTDINKSDIYKDASTATDYISNLDSANKAGKYYVKLNKEDYSSIQNIPNVKLTKDLEAILYCYNKEGRMLQEITIEGITYTRAIGELWTGMNNNLVKKDVIANIEGSTATTFNSVEDIYASCPKLNTHHTTVEELDFRGNDNKYYRLYMTKKTGNEMFYMFNSGSTIYIGSTTNSNYIARYIYSDGAWSKDTSTYVYTSVKIGELEIYKNTLPICKGTSTTTYDKTTIIKEVSDGDIRTITDFNNATEFGVYNVDIQEGEIALNAPIEGVITGTLDCKVIKNNVYQTVKTTENTTYERVYDGSVWSEWKIIGGEVDLSSYATNKDLEQNYYKKEEIDKAIKEAGAPYNGVVGVSSYPAVFATCPVPEKEIIGEVEAFSMYNQRYVKVYIHPSENVQVDLNAVKILNKSNGTYRIQFYSNTIGDYTAYYKTETGDWTLDTSTTFSCYLNTTDINDMRSLVYKNTFDITDGSVVIEAKTGDNLIGSYNSAIKTGTYKASHKTSLEGAPKEAVEGVLVANKADNRIIQTLTENNGKVSTRYYEDAWSPWVGADSIGDISFAIKTEFATKSEYSAMWRFEPKRNTEYPYRLVLTMGTKYGRIIDFKQDPTGFIKYDKSTKKLVWAEGYESLEMLHYYVSDITKTPSYSYSTLNWSTTTTATQYFTSVVLDWYNHNFDILDTEGNIYRKSEEFDTSNVITDFNLATELSKYNVDINVDEEIANKPANTRIKGYMTVEKCSAYIKQVLTTEDVVYKRLYSNSAWSEWEIEVNRDEFDSLNNQVQELVIPIPDKVNTFQYTNSDGMPEIYKWFDMNGFKVMWIDVKMSDAEYGMGSTGLIMKTLNIPTEAQIFNNIIIANITSYCREGENTLSRIVQNAEIISNVSVRGRWRHTDNTYPKIDRFTIMCFGF